LPLQQLPLQVRKGRDEIEIPVEGYRRLHHLYLLRCDGVSRVARTRLSQRIGPDGVGPMVGIATFKFGWATAHAA
jgi:hypothetical protein